MKTFRPFKQALVAASIATALVGCTAINEFFEPQPVPVDPALIAEQAETMPMQTAEVIVPVSPQSAATPVNAQPEQMLMSAQPIVMPVKQAGFHTHQMISDYSDRLAHHLMKTSILKQWSSPIVIASFVQFDDKLTNTSPLGNLLSESLLGHIQQYGVPVVDLHMKGWLEITNTGDYVFSRDVNDIMVNEMAKYVLSGVLIENEKGVTVNARIVEFANQRVISSASVLIPHYVINNM